MPEVDPRPLARTVPAFEPRPVTLAGHLVRLEPLAPAHAAGLAAVAYEEDTWRWGLSRVMDDAALRAYLDAAFAAAESGREIPFVQVEATTGRPIGMTRYHAIERVHRRLEIGYTWLGSAWRRRGHNAEAKLLLLEQAFDRWGSHRVEFKTDANNLESRAALAAIGATEEGTLRRHVVTEAGRVRDSVYFSIIWEEWPMVRARLEERVAARRAADTGPATEPGT